MSDKPAYTLSGGHAVFTSLLSLERLNERREELHSQLRMSLVHQTLKETQMADKPTISPQDYEEVRKRYEVACKEGAKSFRFKEQEVLVSYAYYLLEYLHPYASTGSFLGIYRNRGSHARPPADKPLDKRNNSVQ